MENLEKVMDAFLVIDDEDMVLDQVSNVLKSSFPESRICTASNGVDGIRCARNEAPDVIILDVSMPEMDGFEICKRLKSDPLTAIIPVIMITGIRTDSSSRNKALDIGADDYIYKPFSTEDLVSHVKVFLRIKHTEDALRSKNEQFELELSKRSQKLWESEKQFRELADMLPDVVIETDSELNIRYMNQAGLRQIGYEQEDVKKGLSLRQVVVFNARQGEEHIRQVLEGKTGSAYEYIVRTSGGTKFVARISFSPIVEDDQVKGLRGVLIDITAFKQIERELIESRESFRALFNNMFDSFAVCEVITNHSGSPIDCKFMDVNPAFKALTGKQDSEIIGKTFLDIFPGAELNWISTLGQAGLTGRSVRFDSYFGELGRHFQVSAFSPRRGIVAIILLDITERKIADEREQELQEETTRAKHLELLASLSGAVAHDLNNILGPLMCYPDLIMLEAPPDASYREYLTEIKTSTKKAIAVIEDLLSLGRSGMFKKGPIDLSEIVTSYLKDSHFENLLKNRPDIKLIKEVEEDLPLTYGHAPRLTRVLENLFQNMIDLTPEDGRLRIELTPCFVPRPMKAYSELIDPGKYLVLRITGKGGKFSSEDINAMFDPFSRKSGSGNTKRSLAMALIFSVMKDHDGFVRVVSNESEGAEFALYFRLVDQQVTPRSETESDIKGTEKILLVDDMRHQRSMGRKMLGSLGYRVETASSGREAISMVEDGLRGDASRAIAYDLIILDMMLETDFDGLDTFKKIMEVSPKQKCIIVSGFAKSDRVKQADILGIRGFLRKPYTLEGIGRVVRRVLDSE